MHSKLPLNKPREHITRVTDAKSMDISQWMDMADHERSDEGRRVRRKKIKAQYKCQQARYSYILQISYRKEGKQVFFVTAILSGIANLYNNPQLLVLNLTLFHEKIKIRARGNLDVMSEKNFYFYFILFLTSIISQVVKLCTKGKSTKKIII